MDSGRGWILGGGGDLGGDDRFWVGIDSGRGWILGGGGGG